jgi:glucokinase
MLDLENDVIKLPHIEGHLTPAKHMHNTVAVIGFHFGLGMSVALYDTEKKRHIALPSEGGHMDLAPYDEFECGLVAYIQKARNSKLQPSFECVLSEEGVGNVFDYVCSLKGMKTRNTRMIAQLSGKERLSAIQANYHLSKACRRTMDTLISIYARACRNLALMSECYSGLFIANLDIIKNTRNMADKNRVLVNFMKEFESHPRKSDLLRQIPVYIISGSNPALYGCCNYLGF